MVLTSASDNENTKGNIIFLCNVKSTKKSVWREVAKSFIN